MRRCIVLAAFLSIFTVCYSADESLLVDGQRYYYVHNQYTWTSGIQVFIIVRSESLQVAPIHWDDKWPPVVLIGEKRCELWKPGVYVIRKGINDFVVIPLCFGAPAGTDTQCLEDFAREAIRLEKLRAKNTPNQALERNADIRHARCCAPVAPAAVVAHL
jgi:hypothetical protein